MTDNAVAPCHAKAIVFESYARSVWGDAAVWCDGCNGWVWDPARLSATTKRPRCIFGGICQGCKQPMELLHRCAAISAVKYW